MTTYPLPTLAPTVSSTGISIPSYADVLASLTASFMSIYGTDSYLEPDSQDGQLLAIFASAINDSNNAAVAVYNQFSPATSLGAGLSSVVKINGLMRLVPSNSSADVTVIGQAGSIILSGIIADTNGNQWTLPASVTIPIGGSITETAVAVNPGTILAPANTINKIVTPSRGWQSVNNPADATPGAPVESDATLRQRQSISTQIAAQSILGAIVAAIANLPGVEAVKPYENDTESTDSNTLPPHSIALVVEGGDAVAIATTIMQKKNPGTTTYGTTSETVFDPAGVPLVINFYRPTVVPIDIHITIAAKSGYISTTGDLIVTQLGEYLNALGIGSSDNFVFNSKLYSPANDTGAFMNTYNVTVLTERRDSNSFATTDIPIAFNELPSAGVITLTVV